MQSDGNSFGGDVVLKSINMASSYEDQIYEKQTFSDLYYEDFTFWKLGFIAFLTLACIFV